MNFGIFVNWLGSTLCIIWQPSAKSCYKSTRCESTTTFSFFRQFHYILFLFIFHISHLVMSVLIWFFLQSNFSKNEHFLSPDTHTYVFFGKFGVFCFLVTLALRLALLPYYRRYEFHDLLLKFWTYFTNIFTHYNDMLFLTMMLFIFLCFFDIACHFQRKCIIFLILLC